MIPNYDADTGFLPIGIHEATWDEFIGRYGYTEQRRNLISGLLLAIHDLKSYGCKWIYVDGGFITKKLLPPKDIDVCWDAVHVDLVKLKAEQPVFFDFMNDRENQKAKYKCEFFPAQLVEGNTNKPFLHFFQASKEGIPKGIIKISIEGL